MASVQRSGSFIEAARRAQIVDSAIETIAEFGYANASLARIARRAGISKGVISYHFAGKDELMRQVLTDGLDLAEAQMLPRILAGTTALERLRGHVEGNVAFVKAYPRHLAAIVEILANARDEAGKATVEASSFTGPVDRVADALPVGQEVGELREFDPLLMAQSLRGAIDGMVARFAANPDLDLDAYGRELVTPFELATRKPD